MTRLTRQDAVTLAAFKVEGMAGSKSVRVAGMLLECMAGCVGICIYMPSLMILDQLRCSGRNSFRLTFHPGCAMDHIEFTVIEYLACWGAAGFVAIIVVMNWRD